MSAAVQDLARMRKTAVALAVGEFRPAPLASARNDDGVQAAPAPRPLPPELPPVEAFPLAALPDAFRPWVTDATERMQCPPDFVAVPLLVAAASLAAQRVEIRPRRRDDWTEPGNLWAMIVGRPGMLKTPAMRAAMQPLLRLEQAAAQDHDAAIERFTLEAKAHKLRASAAEKEAVKVLAKNRGADVAELLHADGEPEAPTRRRYIVNGPTWEKLHALLAANPGGLLMERDELSGWFSAMSREENAEARSFFVTAWSGGTFRVDRIGRGELEARDMRLSIIGAIQPGPLTDVLRECRAGGGDDGLIERFLVAWPDDPGEWRDVDRFPDGAAREAVRQSFDRMDLATADELGTERLVNAAGEPYGVPLLGLGEEAFGAFNEWRTDLERRLRASEVPATEAALAKFRHQVPALALTLHLADGGTGPVTGAAMRRALALGEYFESHAARLHASGVRTTVRAAKLVLDKLRAGALVEPFTVRDAHRPRWSGLADHRVVVDAVDLLAAHGWLTETTIDTGGRPTAVYTRTEGVRHGQVA